MSHLRRSARPAYNAWLRARARLRPPSNDGLEWLFLATLPNAGSTATAKWLETAENVFTLHRRGEGQWLVPQMCCDRGRKWQPDLELDYELIRAVWMHHAKKRSGGAGIILEKSPPNLVRMERLIETFSDMPVTLFVLTRDPLAVCASWAKRYPPQNLWRMWLPVGSEGLVDTEEGYYRTLGRLCGQRMADLAELTKSAACVLSYERLTQEPAAALGEVRAALPSLGAVEVDANVSVKDYQPQVLRNMNQEQIATLSHHQRDLVVEGLSPYREAVAALGYG